MKNYQTPEMQLFATAELDILTSSFGIEKTGNGDVINWIDIN